MSINLEVLEGKSGNPKTVTEGHGLAVEGYDSHRRFTPMCFLYNMLSMVMWSVMAGMAQRFILMIIRVPVKQLRYSVSD